MTYIAVEFMVKSTGAVVRGLWRDNRLNKRGVPWKPCRVPPRGIADGVPDIGNGIA